jgi:hypothetical protein
MIQSLHNLEKFDDESYFESQNYNNKYKSLIQLLKFNII